MVDVNDADLTAGERAVIAMLRATGREINAENFAFANFGKDIEDLEAEERDEIPAALLDPWLEEHEGVSRE